MWILIVTLVYRRYKSWGWSRTVSEFLDRERSYCSGGYIVDECNCMNMDVHIRFFESRAKSTVWNAC